MPSLSGRNLVVGRFVMVVGAVDTVDNRRPGCSGRASSCDSAVGGRRAIDGSGVDGGGVPPSFTQAGCRLSADMDRSSTVVHSDVWTTVALACGLGVAMGIDCGEGHQGRPHGYPQPVDKRRHVRCSAHRSRRGHAVHTAVDGSVDGYARSRRPARPLSTTVCAKAVGPPPVGRPQDGGTRAAARSGRVGRAFGTSV